MSVMPAVLPILLAVLTRADIITRGEHQAKHLPKVFWIITVIVLPLVGAILWCLVGRDYGPQAEADTRIRRLEAEVEVRHAADSRETPGGGASPARRRSPRYASAGSGRMIQKE